MELDRGQKGYEEEELVVGTALHPVLGRAAPLFKGAGLGRLEQDLDGARSFVGVQELTAGLFDLVCDVAAASWNLGAPPGTSAGSGALAERLDLGGEPGDDALQLSGVGSLHLFDDLGIAEDKEGG